MPTRERVCGIVLAGGRSRRMGRDKAWLDVAGEPLVARVLAQLAAQASQLYLSVGVEADARYASLGPELLIDALPDAGPLAGLASALTALSQPSTRGSYSRALVVSCDTPELPPSLIVRLIESCDEEAIDAAAAEDRDQRLQPLVGCYRLSAAPKLMAAVEAGERRMRAVEELLRLRRVPLRADELLFNLNTPEALALYRSRG